VAAPQRKGVEFYGWTISQQSYGSDRIARRKCSGAVTRRGSHKGLEASHDHRELAPFTNDDLAALKIGEHLANLCPRSAYQVSQLPTLTRDLEGLRESCLCARRKHGKERRTGWR
jgi:hypothetical protein